MGRLFWLLAACVVLAPLPSVARDRLGETVEISHPRWIDGDTIRTEGNDFKNIRLAAIDAPELDQSCGEPPSTWWCGREALAFVRSSTEARYSGESNSASEGQVYCVLEVTPDRYGRALGTCYVLGENINQQLVREGLAIPFMSERYEPAAALARAERRGIWSGAFVTPQEWRHGTQQ